MFPNSYSTVFFIFVLYLHLTLLTQVGNSARIITREQTGYPLEIIWDIHCSLYDLLLDFIYSFRFFLFVCFLEDHCRIISCLFVLFFIKEMMYLNLVVLQLMLIVCFCAFRQSYLLYLLLFFIQEKHGNDFEDDTSHLGTLKEFKWWSSSFLLYISITILITHVHLCQENIYSPLIKIILCLKCAYILYQSHDIYNKWYGSMLKHLLLFIRVTKQRRSSILKCDPGCCLVCNGWFP